MGTHEPDDIDARFEEIVARWDDEEREQRGSQPGEEGGPDPAGRPDRTGREAPQHESAPGRPSHPSAINPPPGRRASPPAADPSPGSPPVPPPTPPAAPPASPQQRRAVDPRLVYRDPGSGLSMGTDHRSWTPPVDPDDPDDDYVPPPPTPMPSWRADPVWWAILVGLVAGPIVLLTMVLTGHTSPRIYLWLAGLATVAAFVGLVLRLPSTHDEDDDGARV